MTGREPQDPQAPEAVQRLKLPPEAPSATLARRFIRQVASSHSLPDEVVDRLVLVGCELVTNAILHARTAFTLTLELYPEWVRVSVKDRSSAPAALRRYRPEAFTGRGLALVSAVSQRWGVAPASAGKRIWAEIDRSPSLAAAGSGSGGDGAAGRHRQPLTPHHRQVPAPSPPGSGSVQFVGVPVKAFLELQQYNDALVRELELVNIGHDAVAAGVAPAPDRLARLVEEFSALFRSRSDHYRGLVAAAAARGATTVDFRVRADPSGIAAAQAYVDLLEAAEDLSRAGKLLTPPPPPYIGSLRRWFVEQLAAQLLLGAAPTPPGEDCRIA